MPDDATGLLKFLSIKPKTPFELRRNILIELRLVNIVKILESRDVKGLELDVKMATRELHSAKTPNDLNMVAERFNSIEEKLLKLDTVSKLPLAEKHNSI